MPVTDTHKLYAKYLPRWQLVHDCVEGSVAIKERAEVGGSREGRSSNLLALAGTRYLSPPNSEDTSFENTQRYRAYLKRASYVNFTGNTKEGFVGMVFRQDMTRELPGSVQHLEENATGGGLSLDQLARRTVGNVLETGRYGLLTDYPIAPQGLTQAQAGGLRASILTYPAENIINWRTSIINGVKVLSMVVLAEEVEKIKDDGYGVDCELQYRVLWLIDGVYTQQLLDKDGTAITEPTQPRKFDGSLWGEIPFTFVGSNDNDETPDKALLYDIAEVNVAHYRNSADFEESSFMVGQPTPWASGLTQGWVGEIMKGGVMIGSRTVVLLPQGGAFGLAQANPNSMPGEGMKEKEEQLIAIGANIIRDSSGNMRVDQVSMQFAGKTSKLATLVGNVEAALIKSIKWAVEFMGGTPDDLVLTINREFFDRTLDPQAVMAIIALGDRGLIAPSDTRAKLRRNGIIEADRSDEDIENEVGNVDPTQ